MWFFGLLCLCSYLLFFWFDDVREIFWKYPSLVSGVLDRCNIVLTGQYKKKENAMSLKQQILDTATEVFSIVGFYTATVDDIAREAGIAKGSIYYHFKSKDELFITIIEGGIHNIIHQFEEISNTSTSINDVTARCIDFIMDYYLAYPALCSQFSSVNTSGMSADVIIRMRNSKRELYQALSKLLEIGSQNGMVRELDFDLAAVIILSMLDGICREMLDNLSEKRVEKAKDMMMNTFFNGIFVQPDEEG